MNSSRPYLLRAFYEWILDNEFTPYIVINAEDPEANVPSMYVEKGRIVLNIAPSAVQNLLISNTHLEFSARFRGVPNSIYAPTRAIEAIYAKENGRGMVFKPEDDEDDDVPPPPTPPKAVGGSKDTKPSKKGKDGPKLSIVK